MTAKVVRLSEALAERYLREAEARGAPHEGFLYRVVVIDGAPFLRPVLPETLVELIDCIALPIATSVAEALEMADWIRTPTIGNLDEIVVAHAHVLLESGIAEPVVNALIRHAKAVRAAELSRIEAFDQRVAPPEQTNGKGNVDEDERG